MGHSPIADLFRASPDDPRIERLQVRLIGEPLGWDLERPLFSSNEKELHSSREVAEQSQWGGDS